MVLIGTVLRIRPGALVVRDQRSGQIIVVNLRHGRRFAPGDVVAILYSGIMTRSRPPQITPIAIRRIFPRER